MMSEQVVARLRDAGHRITAPRRAVVEVVCASEDALSPAEVFERARGLCPSLGLVTVYRTLDTLAALGLVRRVHTEDGCHGYASARQRHGHHLVCRECSQVVEFSGCGLEPMIAEMSRQTGFEIEHHLLELVGRCPACQAPT